MRAPRRLVVSPSAGKIAGPKVTLTGVRSLEGDRSTPWDVFANSRGSTNLVFSR
jgi:hypothetical protein